MMAKVKQVQEDVISLCPALVLHPICHRIGNFQMELPVTCTELWRCFNMHIVFWNGQVESNVSVSHNRGATHSTISILMAEHKQKMNRHMFYVWVPQTACTGTHGRGVCGWSDTIAGGRVGGCMIDFMKFYFQILLRYGTPSLLSVCQNTGESIICR